MLGTRYENYNDLTGKLPFILNCDLERTPFNYSREQNWHENIEIQLCTAGKGFVLLNGEKHDFCENDIVVVNSNVIHYTHTEARLTYSCIIISTEFCRQMNFDYSSVYFSPLIKNESIVDLFLQIVKEYNSPDTVLRVPRLNKLLLELLIELSSSYIEAVKPIYVESKASLAVKQAIAFIRENYNRKISLDDISRIVLFDKYALCREFKKITGQTIVENINRYRCLKAAEYIKKGYPVYEAARLCGFENFSFFTKTFKKYMSKLPSKCKLE
ncbi:MAG: helix-turn-helix transcriptional regulator [Clostridia bacterium]|nr:helix-turn-helix transcriptional regulator [Clostridia bacterium]